MKKILYYICLLFLFAACSSDDIPEFSPEEVDTEQEDNKAFLKMYDVKFSFLADSAFFYKNVDQMSRAPELTELWLWADYDTDSPKKFQVKLSKVKVDKDWKGNATGKLTANMEMKMGFNEKREVFLSNGATSIQVTKKLAQPVDGRDYAYAHCMLASTGSLQVDMNTAAVNSPAGKPTKRPYGDRLFRTKGFTFDYKNMTAEWDFGTGSYDTFGIFFNVGNSNPYCALATKGSMGKGNLEFRENRDFYSYLTFNLDRYTAGIQVNFCIVDWENKKNPDLQPLKTGDFKKQLGVEPSNWKIRSFLNNVATDFNIVTQIYANSIGTGTGLVSISDAFEPMSGCEVLRGDANPGHTLNPTGDISAVGVMHKGNQGEVFILPMKDNNSDLIFTFSATNTKVGWDAGSWLKPDIREAEYYPTRAFRVPLSDLKSGLVFQFGARYELLVIISLHDFIEVMKVGGSIKPKTEPVTSRASFNSVFGEIIDMPHQLVLRKIKDVKH